MTVLNEITNMKRYNHINFVEFLDMICRIAIVALDDEETTDKKTHKLLGIIYNKYHDSGDLSQDIKLNPVDEKLR